MRPNFRYLVYLLLTPVFFYQLWLAYAKLCTGQPSTFISHHPNFKIQMPEIAFCNSDGMIPVTNTSTFLSLFEQAERRWKLLNMAVYIEEDVKTRVT